MQTRRTKLTVLALACCAFSGCFADKKDSFEKAIAQAREEKHHEVSKASLGLPFYSSKNLDPVWDEGASVVRIPELTLRDHRDQGRSQEFFSGKISFVAFFFATCRGFCPNLLNSLKSVEKELKDRSGVNYVALTVDPEHDDVKSLSRYARKMKLSPNWYLLTGARDTIFSLAKDTFLSQAFQRATQDGDRSFVHSEHFYVIDEKGRLRAVLNGTEVDVAQKAKEVVEQLAPRRISKR